MSEPGARELSLRTAAAMVAFTLVFTAAMAGMYRLTRDTIARSAEAQKLALIDQVLPRSAYDNALLDDTLALGPTPELGLPKGGTVWRARRGGAPVALVLEAAAPDGYSGQIRLIVALDATGTLRGVRVTEHRETPGLGDYIDPAKDRNKARPWIAQFESVPASQPASAWRVRKDGGRFEAMSGATISARAVVGAVARAVAYARREQARLFAAPTGAPR